jgi:hypothetical protein
VEEREEIDRLKLIIETNNNMKIVQEMEEKVKSLTNERQKIFS